MRQSKQSQTTASFTREKSRSNINKTETEAKQPENTNMHASASEGSIEKDLHLLAFSNREAMKASTAQTHDLSQLLSETAPVAHAVAGCFPAAVRPARVVEPTAKIGTA